jgi:citronellol/citronellal dehydrogenase
VAAHGDRHRGGAEPARRRRHHRGSRKPEIMADAAYDIFQRRAARLTGNFFIDDEVLAAAGKTDLSEYQMTPGAQLIPDFFV